MPNDLLGFRKVDLSDKYDLANEAVYLTGTQALVRLCLMQAKIDEKSGINTAGYVTGYRGSPLGGLDQQFASAARHLADADVTFQPGLNEDLAATAVWGTQQVAIRGEGKKEGVFALWYGKGPGVDRSGDVFRHGNLAGSAAKGGVLALLGDDHTCESSTTCHQSEYAMVDAMMPVLNPASIAEIVDFGLHGWALSRYSGLWVGLKCVKDNVESSGSVSLPLDRFNPVIADTELPVGGLNIRANDDRHEQERRLHRFKLDAAQAYARANNLDRVVMDGGPMPRIGIISTGKSWMDTESALEELGIDAAHAAGMGLATYKIGMVWPLEPEGLKTFASGLDLMIVIEEKRGLIEGQAREILYGMQDAPMIIGKRNESGERLFPEEGALDAVMIASALANLIPGMEEEAARISALQSGSITELGVSRTPYFCAGCPHNSSTKLPEGARGYAGIGCHWMAQSMDRATEGYTHMGGEGANWIGEAPFSNRDHVFQNLGDGTYNHSGLMAIRAAVAAGVNITYKILYNDAVAMTGGQHHEGGLPPPQIFAELRGAGVARIVVVSDQPDHIEKSQFSLGTEIVHRDQLQFAQSELAKVKGVSAILYIQTCATEKRRRRKRGLAADPTRRVVINPEVCEGCGDCGLQSNCVAILPLETPLGTKRAIDQSACNKDFSCLKGFCPSFVTVEGGSLRKPDPVSNEPNDLPDPSPRLSLARPKSILLTGVGGTGVVTIGALLGMAAHIEGKGFGLIDMAGLAQKGGAVTTHIRLAQRPEDIKAIRIAPGGADLMLGCDALTGAARSTLALMKPDAHIVANTYEMMTGAFVRDRNFSLPAEDIHRRLIKAVPDGQAHLVNATELARGLLGDTIGANLFMLGAAWQIGLIPLSEGAIAEAVRLNGVAVEFNLSAFRWGRAWAIDSARVADAAGKAPEPAPESLQMIVQDRVSRLIAYQDKVYAERYRTFVESIAQADSAHDSALARAVARNLFKLMAYKDEYEVARLITNGTFDADIAARFKGKIKVTYHLAPPFLPGIDTATGRPRKYAFTAWIKPLMRGLAKLKGLRGSWADPFSYTHERKVERQLIEDYRDTLKEAVSQLNDYNYETVLALAELPDQIRGFGSVKAQAIKEYEKARQRLMTETANPKLGNLQEVSRESEHIYCGGSN